MEANSTFLFNFINNERNIKKFSKTGFTGFCTIHSKILTSAFINNIDAKYFHITDNTKKRIKNVPVKEITGSKFNHLEQGKGFVYFNNGLHFIYLIRNNGVYIMSSSSKNKKKVENGEFYASQLMDGFLYYDIFSDTSTCYINNPLDVLTNKDSMLLKEKETINVLTKIEKETEIGSNDTLLKYKNDYEIKYNNTKLCLQAFMFIFFAKIINTRKISQEGIALTFSEKLKNKNKSIIDFIEVDTFYDESMKVINPFNVSGHFRNQPFGKDRLKRKLTYIDGFMKTGYERKATKLKIKI